MNRLWTVAWHEFYINIKKPSFWVGILGVPFFTIVVMLVVAFLTAASFGSSEIREDAIGYVDGATLLSDAQDTPEGWQTYPDETTAKGAIEAKAIDAYFVLGTDFLQTGSVSFYANGTASEDIKDAIETFITANIARQTNSNLPLDLLERPVSLRIVMENTGREINEAGFIVLFLIPMIFAIIFMISTQISGAFLMSSVVEEKSNRVMELLLTTVSPYQLLGGKIVGLGALGLIQVAIWALFSTIAFALSRNVESLQGVFVPWDLVVIGLVYFILSYFMYSSLFAVIGVLVDGEQESRQYASVFSLVLVIPVILISAFITQPNGTVPTVLSMVPFTSGISMLLRVAFGSVPFWQLALSLGITLITTLVLMWGGAKVFKWASLLYGKPLNLREIWRVIRSNPEIGGVA
jgi:ABC-2 type transport system permease protein